MSSIRPIFPHPTLLPYQAFQQSSAWPGMVFFLMPNNTSLHLITLLLYTYLPQYAYRWLRAWPGIRVLAYNWKVGLVWFPLCLNVGPGTPSFGLEAAKEQVQAWNHNVMRAERGLPLSFILHLLSPASSSGCPIPALSSPLPRLLIPSNPALLRPLLSMTLRLNWSNSQKNFNCLFRAQFWRLLSLSTRVQRASLFGKTWPVLGNILGDITLTRPVFLLEQHCMMT